MVDNMRVPSLPLNSDDESLEHTPLRFTNLSGGSSIVGGESRGNTTSHTTFSQIPSGQLSTERGYPISHPELNEDVTKNSSKRPRGRPPGSKNKPKPPIVITEDDETILKPIRIEIPRGNDIAETLINLAQHHNANITVLSGSGLVTEINLHNPISLSPLFPINETFNMTSICGTYNNPDCGHVPPQFIASPPCSSFCICISDVHGNIFGGTIGGKVMSAGPVIVSATLCKKLEFHRATFINGSFEEVIINADHTTVEPNNNNFN